MSTYTGIMPQDYLESRTVEERTRVWQGRLSDPTRLRPRWFVLVAQDPSGKVVGFAGGGPESGYGLPFSGELGFIYVLPPYQRKGAGRTLVADLVERLLEQGHNSMLVWVLEANPFMVFYEALGGQQVALRMVRFGNASLSEVAYGWADLKALSGLLKARPTV